jgi:hypothetical protein
MQNLLERLPAMASINGNFNKSFSVSFRASFIFEEFSGASIISSDIGYDT